MAEIPFWVTGDRPKWVSGITPSTSCQDILQSLAGYFPSELHPKRLILTEKWRDVERPLSADAKILKIWNAWGDEKKCVKFVVKRVRNSNRKRPRRRGSISSIDTELHPKALGQNVQDKDVIEEMMKIIEIQRKVITEELKKAKVKKKAKSHDAILEEMIKLSQLNDKLIFAEESSDRLEIALRHSDEDLKLIQDHLECAKTEVSKLREANDQAAVEVKDNQKALDAMEELKKERKLALKRLEYDVNVIEKEGRKLAKEYEKVLQINLDDLEESEEDEEEIYALLNESKLEISSSSSGNSSETTKDQESPIDDHTKVNNENNSDTGLSSLHTSSDEGTYEVGTLV